MYDIIKGKWTSFIIKDLGSKAQMVWETLWSGNHSFVAIFTCTGIVWTCMTGNNNLVVNPRVGMILTHDW